MTTRIVPGSGAILEPKFNEEDYSVTGILVINGGAGYASTDPPKIEITGTETPLVEGVFYPYINPSGAIERVVVVNPGLGYFPVSSGEIGITTTSESEGRKDIIMQVSSGVGSGLYENGYNVAISTVTGISSSVVPNFSGIQNRFYGILDPFIPTNYTSGSGVGAKFSVFIVYNSSTGQPISTSVVLRDGGRGYQVGDVVSIAGTFMEGATPQNDLSFTVSKVASTRIVLAANQTYSNIPANSTVGYGTGARLTLSRDSLGDIGDIDVLFGGTNYSLTDNITIAGTYIGGSTPLDNLNISPVLLGTDKLPRTLYVDKINNNLIKVAGISTGGILDITSLGIGTHSFSISDPNPNVLLSIDNIIQTPISLTNVTLQLDSDIGYDDDIIYVQTGISSVSLNSILKVNDEYLAVKNIGVSGDNSISVERAILGTTKSVHSTADLITVASGNYNIIKDVIYFSSPPKGPMGLNDFESRSTFSGRAFSRRFDPFTSNDTNLVLDDISSDFTGIASTEFTLTSNGNEVTNIFSNINSITGSSSGVDINNNPLILLNNVLQTSGEDYVIDTPESNTIKFISGTPIGGKITKVGYTTGFGYIPRVGASATVSVSAAGTISNVYLTGAGDGYSAPPIISIASTVGFGASIVSTIGAGGTITSLTIINPGAGYTNTPLPVVNIDLPLNYNNLPLVYASGYSGIGTGAKASVVVGNESTIIDFTLDDQGIGYEVGDTLILAGLSSNPNAGYFEEFRISVLETFTESFSGWYPGQFIQFDDISPFFNGNKRKFTLTITQFGIKEVISLKANPEDLNITNNILVIINDVLQVPGESYTFNGSRLSFTEAPKAGSTCNVLFFRGSDLDIEQIDPPRTIKEGDIVQINDSILDSTDRPQFERVVKNIVATDILDTFPYDSLGISTDPNKLRPLNWTKQTQDRIMNGVLYSKSRPSLKSRIIPTSYVIKDISETDTRIYVDSALPLFSDIDENKGLSEELRDIVVVDNREISTPTLRTVVSTASTISDVVLDYPGSGYLSLVNPTVSISSRFITRKDPIYNWQNTTGVATSNLLSVGYGTVYVSVGSSGVNIFSPNGIDWSVGQRINPGYNFTDVVAFGNNYIAVGQTAKAYRTTGISTTSTWQPMELVKQTQDILGRPTEVISEYNKQLNKIIYNHFDDMLVSVGNAGGLFVSAGLSTTKLYERNTTFANVNSVAYNEDYTVAVGDIGDILYSENTAIWTPITTKVLLQNLNDIIWDGARFIAVGNNGTVMVSNNNPELWSVVPVNNFNKNILRINLKDGVYTILDSDGMLHFSLDLISWIKRGVISNFIVKDIISIGNLDEQKYVAIGSSGFTAYSTPVLNPAVAISTVSGEKIQDVIIINGGFGYSTEVPTPTIIETETAKQEKIYSIKAKGDFGIIKNITVYSTGNIGFGTTSPAIEFTLESDNYQTPILQNMEYSPLSIGDYFIISNSNVTCGHALTGITTSLGGMSNYPASRVGTSKSFIDGIYRVENIIESSGISTVRCFFTPIPAVGPDIIEINLGINTTGFYGNYSFGMIYDYQNRARERPKYFKVNNDNGLIGIQTGPVLYRTRGLI